MAEEVALCELLACAIDEHAGSLELQFASFGIKEAGVGADVEYVGDKHIVAAKVSDTLDAAFDAYG